MPDRRAVLAIRRRKVQASLLSGFGMFFSEEIEFLQTFVLSFGVSALVVLTKKYHIGLSARHFDSTAVQTAHRFPTPRVGGVGIVLAILLILLVLLPDRQGLRWSLFAVSLAPIFLAGLAEDLGYPVSPLRRLLAAALSSAICVVLLGFWIPRADTPLLDGLFAFAPFAIVFTIFAASGICHAFNLIDGVNGLAAGVGVIVALGLAAIAAKAGEAAIGTAAFLMVPALLGFLALNFPLGKIFLGDAGAYSIGHVLAWLAIALLARVEALTTWAVMLVLFWPVADTALAIYRRRRSGKPAGMPDRLHVHQLVMRALEIGYFGRKRRHIANPVTTMVILPLASAPMIVGVLLWNQPLAAFAAFVLFSVLFVSSYQLGKRFAYRSAKRLNKGARRRGHNSVARNGRSSATAKSQPPKFALPPCDAPAASARVTGFDRSLDGGDI